MTKRPLILVCNDDGVYAPGIKHLWKSVQEFADVVVVAPAAEQSAVSLGITIRHPLRVEKVEWRAHDAAVWSVSGTPADCVKMALNVILPSPPDLILSGINRGSNAGRNVLYSGTIAAVIEGIMHQIPGVAFSTSDYANPNYADAEHSIPGIVKYVLQNPLPYGTFLNVNFPKRELGKLNGIRFTQQGKEYWAENPEKRHHPFEGDPYYWVGAKLTVHEEDEDSDIAWLRKGYATVVPIHVGNLTHHDHLSKEKELFESFVN